MSDSFVHEIYHLSRSLPQPFSCSFPACSKPGRVQTILVYSHGGWQIIATVFLKDFAPREKTSKEYQRSDNIFSAKNNALWLIPPPNFSKKLQNVSPTADKKQKLNSFYLYLGKTLVRIKNQLIVWKNFAKSHSDVSNIDHLKMSKVILELLEYQNLSETTGNEL